MKCVQDDCCTGQLGDLAFPVRMVCWSAAAERRNGGKPFALYFTFQLFSMEEMAKEGKKADHFLS